MLPKNILVVEDELIVTLQLKDFFCDLGIQTSDFVDTAEKALGMLHNHIYDLILMDIHIKGPVDGIRLAKRITQQYHVPIVFITSYYDQETIDEAVEISPYGYIKKPFLSIDIKLALNVAYELHMKLNKDDIIENDIVLVSKEYRYSKSCETFYYKNKPLKLTKNQTKLLQVLIKNMNHPISPEKLTYEIWQGTDIAESSLRTLVYSLRKKYTSIPLYNDKWRGYYLKQEKNFMLN